MITGLHVCKPTNIPQVGQVKTFLVTGDRIKSKAADQGGQSYVIKSVTQSETYKDSYGNLGFNLEIEPVGGAPAPKNAVQGNVVSEQGMSKDDYWKRREERDIEAQDRMGRAHSQEMALRYFDLKGITDVDTQKLLDMTDWFQRDLKRQPKSVVEQQAKTMFNATEETEGDIPF